MAKKRPNKHEKEKERKRQYIKSTAWIDEHQIENPGMRQFLIVYARVGTISGACRELGFGVQKIENWQKGFTTSLGRPNLPTPEGPRFKEAMEEARKMHLSRLEMELERRSMKGSDSLLMFYLRSLDPVKYRESGKMSGATGLPAPSPQVQVTVNQLIQTALQDPDKLNQVMELAKKHGLIPRLMGAEVPEPDLPITFSKIVEKTEEAPKPGSHE